MNSKQEILKIWVPGRPRTKGSLAGGRTGAGSIRMTDSVLSKTWRKAIEDRTVPLIADPVVVNDRTRWQLREGWPLAGPIVVSAIFSFRRLAKDEEVRPIGHRYGDLDKLLRNVFDALQSAKVYAEDCQVSSLGRVEKRFAEGSQGEGAMIWVYRGGAS